MRFDSLVIVVHSGRVCICVDKVIKIFRTHVHMGYSPELFVS